MPAVPPGEPFIVHVAYMDEPRSRDPVRLTASNPGCATIEEDPEHPGDPTWARVTPSAEGDFVLGATDGLLTNASPAFDIVPGGTQIVEFKIILAE